MGRPLSDLLDDHVSDHPMSSFREFSSLTEGDSYLQQLAVLLNELSTHVIIEVDSKEELEEFVEKVDRPIVAEITDSGDLGKGDLYWADPNLGVINSLAGSERLEELEQRLDDSTQGIEDELRDLPGQEELQQAIRESANYDYAESKNVEVAEQWWELLNIMDFISDNTQSPNVDGGYFRDIIMGSEQTALAVAESSSAMQAVFAAHDMEI